MNGDSFSKCSSKEYRCCHGIRSYHNDASTPQKLTHVSRTGLDGDISQPREANADVPTGVYGGQSVNCGRRRSESAPDALLDCLHCGKDFVHSRNGSSSRWRRKEKRRNTVAGQSACCPSQPLPPCRLGHRPKNEEWSKDDACQPRCQLSPPRQDVKPKGPRRFIIEQHYCGDQGTNLSSYVPCHFCEEIPNHDDPTVSCANKLTHTQCSFLPRDEPWTTPTGQIIATQTTAKSETEESVDFSRDKRRFVGFNGTTSKDTADYDYDGTFDDDSETGFANVNENRRRKSLTSFTEHGLREDGKQPGDSRNHRHSFPYGLKKKNSSSRRRMNLSRSPKKYHGPKCEHDTGQAKCSESARRRSSGKVGATQPPTSTSEDEEENVKARPLRETGVGRHDSLLMTNLSDMQRRHRLCDVVLRCNGHEVAAHKLALAAFSETFAHTYCESEHKQVVIDIPDTSVGGIQEVLRFVYLGTIRLTPDNVAHVLAAAAHLHIEYVVNMCKQMILHPDAETVIAYSFLAEKYHLCQDLGLFYDLICKHFLRVSRTHSWRKLTFGQVFDFLSEDNLSVERELDVFHAAVAWIDANRANRLTFAADLIGCVRFVYITPDEIAKHVETKQFLFQGDEGKELLLCIYRHHALQTCGCQHGHRAHCLPRRNYVPIASLRQHDQSNSATRPSLRSLMSSGTRHTKTTPIYHTIYTDVILCVGGVNPFQSDVEPQARLVGQYHPVHNRWTTVTRLPDGRHHHGAVVMKGMLYIIGGSVLDEFNPSHLCNPTASCQRYDIASKQWNTLAPLNTARMYHCTAVLNGVIFVVAGQTQRSRHLTTMECFRPEVGEWEAGVDMSEARIGVAMTAYQGLLYAVGGFLETDSEHVVRDTVDVFDPSAERWSSLNRLPSPRCHAGLAECRDKLYLVGGSTFPGDSSTVSSLPSILLYSETDDRWDRIQTLSTARHDMGIAVLGSCIFIVGGVSSTKNNVLNDVQCYDVDNDFWLDDVQPISDPALGLVCVAVPAEQ